MPEKDKETDKPRKVFVLKASPNFITASVSFGGLHSALKKCWRAYKASLAREDKTASMFYANRIRIVSEMLTRHPENKAKIDLNEFPDLGDERLVGPVGDLEPLAQFEVELAERQREELAIVA